MSRLLSVIYEIAFFDCFVFEQLAFSNNVSLLCIILLLLDEINSERQWLVYIKNAEDC